MSLEETLKTRAANQCELCKKSHDLSAYSLPPKGNGPDQSVLICGTCLSQVEGQEKLDTKHWYCLKDSIWSEHLPVQVIGYRLLQRLKGEAWAQDLLEQLYLDESALEWAQSGIDDNDGAENVEATKDSNGTVLEAGDAVTLIKDLVVKGANFTAKRGTMVKNISLSNDPKFVEGRVNGTHIVLVAAYLKKA